MIRLDRTVTVSAPPADAFAFVADFANIEHWDPGVSESRQTSEGPVAVGTEYHVVASFMGVPAPMTYRVTRWEPGELVELHGEASTVDAVDRISFKPAPEGGTEIRYEAEFTFRFGLGFAEPVMRRVFERIGDKAMGGLVAATIPPTS